MITLKLTFPWGRYYAHPWGLNPSRLKEGEWPPSPWRLLRALSSAWFQSNPGDPPSEELLNLLKRLGEELPEIGFGKVSFGQTAHWQPNFGALKKKDKEWKRVQKMRSADYLRTFHENHFTAVSTPVFFHWASVSWTEEQQNLLASFLPQLTYFGRAESLCDACLETGKPSHTSIGWATPCLDGNQPKRKMAEDCRDLFCPDPLDFQPADLWSLRKDRPDTWDNLPLHLVDQILSKQPAPDGARWVSYQMPDGWPATWVVRVAKSTKPKPMQSQKPVAHTLRFSLQCRIAIPIKATVDVAERFRQSAIKRFKEACGENAHSFAISGHEPKPEGISGDHQHAHFLPLPCDLSQRGSIGEIHIWAPCGFTQTEVEVLMRVKTVHWGASKYPIRPVLTSISQEPPAFLSSEASNIWRSLTPFVPPKHFYRGNLHGAKLKQKDSPENQLAAELERLGISSPVEIRRIPLGVEPPSDHPLQADWDIVHTPGDNPAFDGGISAETHGNHERRIGFFFEFTLDQPAVLSRPLGHSSHFGLGLFAPV